MSTTTTRRHSAAEVHAAVRWGVHPDAIATVPDKAEQLFAVRSRHAGVTRFAKISAASKRHAIALAILSHRRAHSLHPSVSVLVEDVKPTTGTPGTFEPGAA